jgi:inosine-uridine nucleoside N-ribohydrolase
MYLIRPDIFQDQQVCVNVQDSGRLTVGQIVVDWTGRWKRSLKTLILTKVDQNQFEKELLNRLARLIMFTSSSENRLKRAKEQIEATGI